MAVNCLSFDGGDNVDFGNNAAHQITGKLGIEIWLKRAAGVSAVEVVVSKYDSGGAAGYELQLTAAGKAKFVLDNAAGECVGATDVDDGVWNHVACVRDTDPATDDQFIYFNAVQDGTLAENITLVDSGENFSLGKRADLGTNLYAGKCSDLRLWTTDRSAANIAADYQQRLVGNETNLVGYWKIDEGTGTSLDDLTSNNLNGTFGAAGAAPTWATDGPDVFGVGTSGLFSKIW